MQNYFEAPKSTLIYVFRINDAAHADCLKIGETSLDDDSINVFLLQPNASVLNKAARQRIDQYTQTAGINYELLYTESAVYLKGNGIGWFNDKEVHQVLLRSGIQRKEFNSSNGKGTEWFATDLETTKRAIKAVKEGRKSLSATEVTHEQSPIIFRPEQRDAIDKTLKQFKKGNQMLWNAKMRFGKTLSALQVVKEKGFERTLILTHRPVVDSGWFEDFGKIFYDTSDYLYGSKTNGESFSSLEHQYKINSKHYVYFASMQDLRGSETVGGKFDKNDDIFTTAWNLIIVDEAHEGTQTALGKAVMTELAKPETKVLRLSGTPFNLLDEFKEDEIYTWDYVMEQRAKASWDETHLGDPNPYAGLPRLNIYTYDLGRLLSDFADEEIAFNFREFFRVGKNGCFTHEKDVGSFLNLLAKENAESMYPFANDHYRSIFRHTLWMLPGVKAAKALSAMLQAHPVFQHFHIVNVAGEGDEDEENSNALRMVEDAIGKTPDETRTITLSCGRLTTGVSVKAWSGVLMLSGSYNTAASAYMQTIFRVQTPATINGRVKEDCYVFDFAPDRTLQVLSTVPRVSTKAGKTTENQKHALGEFLNFCSVISIEGSKMEEMNVTRMLQQLKKAYVERVVRNGFEDSCLYNDELLKLTDMDIRAFEELKADIGQTKAMGNSGNIDVNNQGLTNEEYEEQEKLEKKKKKELTDEEKARLEELKKKKKVKEDAISILRGISIRMPLLIYGADIKDEDTELTIDNFTTLVDPQSWEEFMPRVVTKQKFNTFKKYYDPEIFSAAGKRIRAMARAADKLTVEERIARIASIFYTFRNPDKETVLTPWKVVNRHMGDCLGGFCFYDKDYSEPIDEPRYIDHGEVTADVFSVDSCLLEINSKSGLYPLYLAYNIYRVRLKDEMFSPETLEEHQTIWDKAIAENIFVICKTPMAKSITRRTLMGFRKGRVNTRYFEDLINQIKNKPEHFIEQVNKFVSERTGFKNMKFNAIVGNPPYQVMNDGAGASASPVYNLFVDISKKLLPKHLSLIMPARWFAGGRGVDEFRKTMLSDKRLSLIHDFFDARACFSNVEIKGGIMYFRWDKDYCGKCHVVSYAQNGTISIANRPLIMTGMDSFIRHNEAVSIVEKVRLKTSITFDSIVSSRDPFGLDVRAAGTYIQVKPKFTLSKNKATDVAYYYFGWRKNGVGYLDIDKVNEGHSFIESPKLFIPCAWGNGRIEEDRLKPFIPEHRSVCFETYLMVGPFYTWTEVGNAEKYINTKFFHLLVAPLKISQHATQGVYRLVPLQNFTENSDIDWSKSIAETDAQLYVKYGLNKEEIAFIESMIKPM